MSLVFVFNDPWTSNGCDVLLHSLGGSAQLTSGSLMIFMGINDITAPDYVEGGYCSMQIVVPSPFEGINEGTISFPLGNNDFAELFPLGMAVGEEGIGLTYFQFNSDPALTSGVIELNISSPGSPPSADDMCPSVVGSLSTTLYALDSANFTNATYSVPIDIEIAFNLHRAQ